MSVMELRTALVACAMILTYTAIAQSEERIAYVPLRAVEHTADNEAMGFRTGAVGGLLEMSVPSGTRRVDILNAKGNVVRSFEQDEVSDLDLGSLARGTWTLRAHTPNGFSVRRFVVMQPGSVAWAVPRSNKRN